MSLLLLPERARTMVLDLQGDECWFKGPFRRGAIYAENDVSEIREIRPCEVAAAPDAAQYEVFRTFLRLFQFHVPGEETGQCC